jgi:hypothetical protein
MRPLCGKVGSLLRSLLKFIGSSGLASIRPYVNPLYWTFLPRPTKGWPCGLLGPRASREVSYPSGGPGGYSSPTSPRSLGWFWNNRPKDPRSSLQSLILTRNALEISLSGHYFWTLSDLVKTIFYCILLLLFLEFGVLSQAYASEVSILHCRTSKFIGCTEGAPNGCSPRASSGFLQIIHSKVFISSLLRNHFYFPLVLFQKSALS